MVHWKAGKNMFKIGDYIIYGFNGVCKVEDIGTVRLSGIENDRLYYTLHPYGEKEGVIYTPVDNKKTLMRSILTKEEAKKLLDEIDSIDDLGITDERARETTYKEVMNKCDSREWVRIIKTLDLRKETRIAEGKKITASDEKYLRLAQENLYSELSVALDIPKNQMEEYILDYIAQKN
jgi:CarD family transcriptional regulator